MNPEEIDIEFDKDDLAFSTLAQLLVLMRLSAYTLSIFGLTLSGLILLGGDARFSAAAYSASMLVPGAPETWGWTFLIFSVAAFAALRLRMYKFGAWAFGCGGVWNIAFALAFLISAIQYANANLTAIAAYAALGVLFLLTAQASRLLALNASKGDDLDAGPETHTSSR